MINMLIGALFITIGATLLNSISEAIMALTELFKANINERIVRHNAVINQINETGTYDKTRAIGFVCDTEEEYSDEEC